MTGFPYFRIAAADPRERGRQLGLAAKGQIEQTVEFYRSYFSDVAALQWPDVRRAARKFRPVIAAYDEQVLEEIDGIAEGADLSVDDVLAINARTELMFGLAGGMTPECTAFYVGPSASADGHVLLGQNWDYYPGASASTILVEVEQRDRPSFVMLAEAGLVGKLGFNAAGIGVATNFLLSDRDKGQPAVPYHVVLRGILNSKSAEEALSAVVRARRAASANYLIASAAGIGVNLETGPGGVETVFVSHPTDDLIAHANNFTCAVNLADAGLELIPGSPGRMTRMSEQLQARRGSLTREELVELLRDHHGRPDSICQHENEELPQAKRAASLASWVIDLTERVANICAGQPCAGTYEWLAPAFSTSPELVR